VVPLRVVVDVAEDGLGSGFAADLLRADHAVTVHVDDWVDAGADRLVAVGAWARVTGQGRATARENTDDRQNRGMAKNPACHPILSFRS